MYRPSKWQQSFHARKENEVLGAGAAGPGKSICLRFDVMPQIQLADARMHGKPERVLTDDSHPLWYKILNDRVRPGYSTGWALLLMRTYKRLAQHIVAAKRVFEAIEPGVHYHSESMTFTFKSGFRYQFGHCHKPDDWEQYMTQEYTWIGYDELVHFLEEQYFQINTRLRSSDALLRGFLRIRAMSNPVMKLNQGEVVENRDPQWVRRYFVDPAPEGNTVIRKSAKDASGKTYEHTRIYLPARLEDNPDKEFVEEFKQKLIFAKPHIKKALLDGDWYVVPGAFYEDDWDTHTHVIKKFALPPDWHVFRSMDWGFKSFGCVHWWALDGDDNMYGIKEMTFRGRHAKDVARDIREVEKKMGLWDNTVGCSMITGPADTQLWEQRGSHARPMSADMAKVGVKWVKADKFRTRKRNAGLVSERLRHSGTHSMRGGLFLFSNCVKLIQTLPAVQTNPNDPEEPADGGEDHWIDSLFYAAAHASYGRYGKKRRPSRAEPEEVNRGEYGYGAY